MPAKTGAKPQARASDSAHLPGARDDLDALDADEPAGRGRARARRGASGYRAERQRPSLDLPAVAALEPDLAPDPGHRIDDQAEPTPVLTRQRADRLKPRAGRSTTRTTRATREERLTTIAVSGRTGAGWTPRRRRSSWPPRQGRPAPSGEVGSQVVLRNRRRAGEDHHGQHGGNGPHDGEHQGVGETRAAQHPEEACHREDCQPSAPRRRNRSQGTWPGCAHAAWPPARRRDRRRGWRWQRRRASVRPSPLSATGPARARFFAPCRSSCSSRHARRALSSALC